MTFGSPLVTRKAKTVLACFEENNLDLDRHPPLSSNFTQLSYQRYPAIIETPGGPDKVKETLTCFGILSPKSSLTSDA